MKKILAAFFMALAVMLAPQLDMKAYSFALKCEPLEKACLPLPGRMVRDQKAACHCPPEQRCPTGDDEWKNPVHMDPAINNFCCPKPPKMCSFQKDISVACTAPVGTEKTEVKYCTEWVPTGCNNNNSDICSKLKVLVPKLNVLFAQYRTDIQKESNSTDVTGKDFDDALEIMKVINDIKNGTNISTKNPLAYSIVSLQAEIADYNTKNGKNVKLECVNQEKDSYCVNRVAVPCPVDEGCVKNRGDIDPQNHFITPEGVFNDKNPDALKYEESVKDKCPVVTWSDCVAEGTMVTMADGSKRKIQEIRVGEFVKGYNANNKVTGITLEEAAPNKLFSINTDALHITPNHPILTVAGWKAIHPEDVQTGEAFGKQITKLVEGDEIIIADEATVKVKAISSYTGPKVATYNLAVNGDFTFIANGLVVRAYKNSTRY